VDGEDGDEDGDEDGEEERPRQGVKMRAEEEAISSGEFKSTAGCKQRHMNDPAAE
jgi:hypothetical protein